MIYRILEHPPKAKQRSLLYSSARGWLIGWLEITVEYGSVWITPSLKKAEAGMPYTHWTDLPEEPE